MQRYIEIEGRDIETEKQRDRADKKKSQAKLGSLTRNRNRKIVRWRDILEKYQDREIKGRDRNRGEKQSDRADNKNPKQSWVAQLVLNIFASTFQLLVYLRY